MKKSSHEKRKESPEKSDKMIITTKPLIRKRSFPMSEQLITIFRDIDDFCKSTKHTVPPIS